MLPLPRGAVWQLFFLLCVVLLANEVRTEERVVCYYTNWSVYRPGTAKFNPQNINPYLCTHLVYAFGGFTKDNTMKPFDKYQDIEQGGYAKFTGLKTYNKQLKTMIAIGGWNEASSRFSPLVASSERRQQFIKNILKFLRQNHFDGLDLDWEYPAHREGGKSRDKDNYAQFVQELRAEFDRESAKTGRPRLLLTMAVPAGIQYIEKGYDIPKLNKYLDWFNLLTYDFHSSTEPSANHHAPLYSLEEEDEYNYDSELNIDYSIKFYLDAGADRDKLVLGIPTYGRSYTLFNEESTELGAPADGPGEQGDATREKGYLAYYEICQNIKEDPDWTVVQPNPKAMGPYAFKGNQWVGYDDEAIVRKKAEYVVENGLGGIMFWAIDNDDFRGLCTGKPYPLIEAAKEAYLDRLGVGDNEVAKPSPPKKKPLRNRNRPASTNRNKVEEVVEKSVSNSRKKPAARVRPQTERPAKTTTTSTTTSSSLYVGGRTTTPAPPTTPDPGSDFKCEDEGFFQHPRDCKKYFWCLDSGPSNLGIVAHQFTCPSGLYFNPSADSCDFARNVPCDKKHKEASTTTSKPITTTTSTTTPRTTTSSYRITAATSRNSFLRYSTTTTEAPEEEEEEYEDEPADTAIESEEDPRVIKELIDLIKKVGGIEELEKHILQQDDGTVMLRKHDSSSTGITTTPSSISKKLYEKVLNRPTNLSAFRNKFTSSSLFRSSSKPKTVEEKEEEVVEEEQEDNNKNSKYSSVVRNSRPGPQNAGIEKLAEFEGFLKEKKKYVTIKRPRPASASSSEDENEDEEENNNSKNIQRDSEDEEDGDEKVEALSVSSSKRPSSASTPAYTSIRRTKGTTLKPEVIQNDEEAEDVAEEAIPDKKAYVPLNRNRVRSTTENTLVEIESTTVAAGSRYKFLERTRPTRRALTTISTSKEHVDEESAESEDPLSVTVQYLEPNDISTQSPTQQQAITTTRSYSSIGRRTTTTISTTVDQAPITTTQPESLLSDTTTPEPIIISTTTTTSTTQTTTNPTSIETSTLQSSTTTTPIFPALSLSTTQTSSTLQDEEEATIAPKIPNSQTSESGLDTQELDSTTATTTATTDDTDRNEVTNPTSKSTSTTTTTTPSSIKSQSSLNSSNSIRGSFNNKYNGGGSRRQQQQRTKSTTPSTDTTQETSTSTNEFLGTVSSPRPFGFPRRRTRPTLANKSNGGLDDASSLSSSTASPSETSTPAIIKKIRTKVPVRRPNLRRRLFTTTQPASSNSTDELNNTDGTSTISSITTKYDASAPTTSLFKNNRRTRPNYLTTISAKLKPTAKAMSSSSSSNPVEIITSTISTTGSTAVAAPATTSSNDITFVTVNKPSNQKSPSGVIRRKFTRPLNGNRLNTNSTANTTTTASTSSGSGSGSTQPAAETSDEVGTDVSKTQNPLFKRRFPPSTTTTAASVTTTPPAPIEFNTSPLFLDTSIPEDLDQIAKSSIQESKFFHNQIGDNLDDHDLSAKVSISTTIFRSTSPSYTTYEEPITRRLGYAVASTRRPSLRRPQKTTPIPENVEIFISRRRPQKTPAPFNKIIETPSGQTYKPSSDYDYYDDGDERVIDKPTASQVKVVLHGKGIIECLDQGNFPHPLSCRKFISCAKFETGGVVGWEYTCPKGLSYDPVGGMCNWSAGLGCNE